jgi:hypothetical protein
MTMKSSKFTASFFSSLVFTALSASGCVSVDADVPAISLTQSDLSFDAMPVEVTQEISVSQSFSFAHDPVELPDGVDSSLRTVDVTLTANQGIDDFAFVRNMRIQISDGVNPTFDLASFDRAASARAGSDALVLDVNAGVDTLSAMKTDSITFIIDMTGSLPKVAWSMDIAIHLEGEIGLDYSL